MRRGRSRKISRIRQRVLLVAIWALLVALLLPQAGNALAQTAGVEVGGGRSAQLHDDTSPAVVYLGQWSVGRAGGKFGGSDHWTTRVGASASFTFTGNSISVLGIQAPSYATLSVVVDGGRPDTVTTHRGSFAENQTLTSVNNLAAGSHTIKITVSAVTAGGVAAIDGFVVGQSPGPVAPDSSEFVTRVGNQLMLNGRVFRFAGTNEYYLGLDDNIRDAAGDPTYPTHTLIDNALDAAVSTGATVVRSHTLGISVGCARCIQPQPGTFNAAAFDSADYAIYRAGQLGLKLMVPLVDQWRWYHGGISTFTGWAGYPNNPDASVNASNNATQRASEANFYTDPRVIGSFQSYISYVLNHVNPYTGLAYKHDPTIMAWETGNELWTATPSWTQSIAAFIKHTVGSKQLVADGSAAHGMSVAQAAIGGEDVDIVGGHFYPIDLNWLKADAAIAAANNKVYIVGEFDWTNASATQSLISAVEADRNIAGDFYWTLLPRTSDGTPVKHDDGFAMHWPGVGEKNTAILAALTAHANRMSTAH